MPKMKKNQAFLLGIFFKSTDFKTGFYFCVKVQMKSPPVESGNKCHTQALCTCTFEGVPLVEFMYLVSTCMPGESY